MITLETRTHTAPSGRAYLVEVVQDDSLGYPWEENDGHGSIRQAHVRFGGDPDKRPGEVVIHTGSSRAWLYDFAAAVKTARADGWGAADCRPDMTPGQRAAQAAKDDMAYCRGWLTGDRCYVGVCVHALDADGEPQDAPAGFINCLWGVEYGYDKDSKAYVAGVALELITECETAIQEQDAREATESAYWASRDVLTEGA
jgi:hypothetical protein